MFFGRKNSHVFLKGLLSTFLFVFFLVPAFTRFAHALDRFSESEQSRSLPLWGTTISYQFILKEDPKVKFDGEAFFRKEGGQRINYVVVNTAFFRKEALELFSRFKQTKMDAGFPSMAKLKNLEGVLLPLQEVNLQKDTISSAHFEDLKHLQNALEKLAWSELVQDSLRSTNSEEEAFNQFLSRFTKIRVDTIERHEAAHLIDIQGTKGDHLPGFDKKTELGAFFTELAYGPNPQDVMAQAIAGLLDELKKGKPVDYSIEKVTTTLEFLKECPRFSKNFKGPMAKCCLEILARLKPVDFIYLGQSLYQKNQAQDSKLYAWHR